MRHELSQIQAVIAGKEATRAPLTDPSDFEAIERAWAELDRELAPLQAKNLELLREVTELDYWIPAEEERLQLLEKAQGLLDQIKPDLRPLGMQLMIHVAWPAAIGILSALVVLVHLGWTLLLT